MAERMRDGWLLLALTAIALAVRLPGLNGGLWYDEIVTLVISIRQPLVDILTRFPGNNAHPLYSVIAHLGIGLLGESAWTVRLPAVLFGVVTIPVIYGFGRVITSRGEALVAAAVLTLSYHHVWFSQNARGYSALALWTLVSTWLVLRAREHPTVGNQIGYGVVGALGAYTHLTMGFVIAAHVMAVLGRRLVGSRRSPESPWLPFLGFAIVGGLTLILYGPLLLEVRQFFAASTAAGTEVATRSWAVGEALRGLRVGLGTLGVAAAGLLALAGLMSYGRRDPELAFLIVAPGVLTVLGTVVMGRPIFPRFFFFEIGFVVLVVVRGGAMALGWLRQRVPSLRRRGRVATDRIAVGMVLTIMVLALRPVYRFPKQDFAGALRYVDTVQAPGDVVATTGLAAFPFVEYYERDWPELRSAADVATVRAARSRVWVVYTFPAYVEAMTPEVMTFIRESCPTVRRFPGTVGGGDLIVCSVRPSDGRASGA